MPLLNLATIGDEAFRFGTAVLLQTVGESTACRVGEFQIVDVNLTAQTRDKLVETAQQALPGMQVRFIPARESTLYRRLMELYAPKGPSHRASCCFAKFAMLDIAARELSNVLFMDSDIYCNIDVAALRPLCAGSAISAVMDTPTLDRGFSPEFEAVGLDKHAPFFNSGVMHFELDAWRDEAWREQVVEILRPKVRIFSDQPVFNILCYRKWHALPPEWNRQCPYRLGIGADVQEGRRENIHFLTNPKPWEAPPEPPSQFFFDALDRTPFRGWRPNGMYWALRQRMRAFKYGVHRMLNK